MQKITVDSTLAEIRYAHLRGRLYPHPSDKMRRRALRALRTLGLAGRIPSTGDTLGGWFARPGAWDFDNLVL